MKNKVMLIFLASLFTVNLTYASREKPQKTQKPHPTTGGLRLPADKKKEQQSNQPKSEDNDTKKSNNNK